MLVLCKMLVSRYDIYKLNTLTMNDGLYYFQWIFLGCFSYIEYQ